MGFLGGFKGKLKGGKERKPRKSVSTQVVCVKYNVFNEFDSMPSYPSTSGRQSSEATAVVKQRIPAVKPELRNLFDPSQPMPTRAPYTKPAPFQPFSPTANGGQQYSPLLSPSKKEPAAQPVKRTPSISVKTKAPTKKKAVSTKKKQPTIAENEKTATTNGEVSSRKEVNGESAVPKKKAPAKAKAKKEKATKEPVPVTEAKKEEPKKKTESKKEEPKKKSEDKKKEPAKKAEVPKKKEAPKPKAKAPVPAQRKLVETPSPIPDVSVSSSPFRLMAVPASKTPQPEEEQEDIYGALGDDSFKVHKVDHNSSSFYNLSDAETTEAEDDDGTFRFVYNSRSNNGKEYSPVNYSSQATSIFFGGEEEPISRPRNIAFGDGDDVSHGSSASA